MSDKSIFMAAIIFVVFGVSTAVLLPQFITPSFDKETSMIFAFTPTIVGIIAVLVAYVLVKK